MNRSTSMSIARILVRLNSKSSEIGSRVVYLSTIEGDNVAGGGDTIADGDKKSLMSDGGRAQSSCR